MQSVHRLVLGIARLMAMLGGAVLTLLILITCISILGRASNSVLHAMASAGILPGMAQGLIDAGVGAIRGDFEMVEAGMAFCIFAFLPFCTVTGGHASVDVFTNFLPRGVNRVLEVLIAALFAAVLVVIAMQLNEGFARKLNSGQTSLLLEFPIWWSYALSLFGAVMSAAVGVYVALVRLIELLTGRAIMPNAVGADH
ncbi:TRAP transporter small permease [Tropicibacter naphthalenivorans]|uniref:TRAP transporter small permease protein n=1 Tax=Tropicibacter naphthalenivorans TaxID=441103 RepID=A0A0P1GJ02_9RHOB|nr:TRAP transporter small permease [Tropicibacter naphthalenivorans]CUH82060.1 TRAP-type C4-dicarboxylate transport system, small permease component [Tropicibacter naphthalenivorans]SMD08362.1 Tripartite ATP-independent transporter, DctQ component [Tropicibacter naphthalenivorans]